MKRFSIITGFLLILLSSAISQDGRIIEQKEYTYPDSTITAISSIFPDIRSASEKVRFFRITYLSDGLKVKGYLAIPRKEGKHPCIIYNRGGSREFSAINDRNFLRWIGKLAAENYVVVASQYRGNAGGEGKEEFGGKDLNDVINLFPLLASIPQADTSRIGMFGLSRGGMMTYLAMTQTNKLKAAVVLSGLADLPKALASRPEMDSNWAATIPEYRIRKDEVLKARSATSFADKMNKSTPLLIVQGSGDWRVPSDQVLDLVQKLYVAKQPMRFILYEGGQHSMIEHVKDLYTQMLSWFNDYLRDGKKLPDLNLHGE